MTEVGLHRVDSLLDAVRERPGLALAVAASSGLIIGALAGSYVLPRMQAEGDQAAKVNASPATLGGWCIVLSAILSFYTLNVPLSKSPRIRRSTHCLPDL